MTEQSTSLVERKNLINWNLFGVFRRVKKSEAIDGAHVRIKIIAHNKGDLVRDVFAGTPALKVFQASHGSWSPEHGHKVIVILDVADRSRARSQCRVVVDQRSLRHAESCTFVARVFAQ